MLEREPIEVKRESEVSGGAVCVVERVHAKFKAAWEEAGQRTNKEEQEEEEGRRVRRLMEAELQ